MCKRQTRDPLVHDGGVVIDVIDVTTVTHSMVSGSGGGQNNLALARLLELDPSLWHQLCEVVLVGHAGQSLEDPLQAQHTSHSTQAR